VGWFAIKAGVLERILLMIAALCLIKPGVYTDIAGLGLLAAVLCLQLMVKKKNVRSGALKQVT